MKNFYEIAVCKMTDHETIYSQMTEEEKQTFDLTVDYGFIEEAKKIMRGEINHARIIDGYKRCDP